MNGLASVWLCSGMKRLTSDRIDPASLALTSAFTLRRRGVEAKLVLDDAAPEIDRTLLTNIARGWSWFNEIKQGISMQEIARRESQGRDHASDGRSSCMAVLRHR
jgi:hypothetical protein